MLSYNFAIWRTSLKGVFAVLLLAVLCCGGSKDRTVNARGGLYMRQAPRLNAKSIELLPNGAKVQFIEEANQEFTLDGLVGKWTKVKNFASGNQGWVFGGFLEYPKGAITGDGSISYGYRDVRNKQGKYEIMSGSGKSALIHNAASYYTPHWTSVAGESDRDEAKKILRDPKADIKIEKLGTNIAVVSASTGHARFTDLARESTLWQLKDDKWRQHPANIEGNSLELIDMNNDGIDDIVSFQGGGNESTGFWWEVFIGKADGSFLKSQRSQEYWDLQIRSKGKCNENSLQAKLQRDASVSTEFEFECKVNKFLPKKG